MFVRISKPSVSPRAVLNAISGKSEIAHHQLVFGVGGLQPCFKPAAVLHAIGQTVTNNGDAVMLFKRYRSTRAARCQKK